MLPVPRGCDTELHAECISRRVSRFAAKVGRSSRKTLHTTQDGRGPRNRSYKTVCKDYLLRTERLGFSSRPLPGRPAPRAIEAATRTRGRTGGGGAWCLSSRRMSLGPPGWREPCSAPTAVAVYPPDTAYYHYFYIRRPRAITVTKTITVALTRVRA